MQNIIFILDSIQLVSSKVDTQKKLLLFVGLCLSSFLWYCDSRLYYHTQVVLSLVLDHVLFLFLMGTTTTLTRERETEEERL